MQAFALAFDKTVSHLDVNPVATRRARPDLHQQSIDLCGTRLHVLAVEPKPQQIDQTRLIQTLQRLETRRVTGNVQIL